MHATGIRVTASESRHPRHAIRNGLQRNTARLPPLNHNESIYCGRLAQRPLWAACTAAARHSGLPALADDAGLCVDAFGGLPGVQTAHYATQFGYAKGDDNNVLALLAQMRDIDNRRAALVSTLVAVRSPDDPEPLIAVGRVVGEISRAPRGHNGFGFDPVMFIPELGKTFAELPVAEKNARSHRGQAARAMLALMRERWLTP